MELLYTPDSDIGKYLHEEGKIDIRSMITLSNDISMICNPQKPQYWRRMNDSNKRHEHFIIRHALVQAPRRVTS